MSREVSPFQASTPLSISGIRAEVVWRVAKLLVIPAEPPAPAFIVGKIDSVVQKPHRLSTEMISILKDSSGVRRICNEDPPSSILIDGQVDHRKGIRCEMAPVEFASRSIDPAV
jgi:hypothetical protein